MLNKLLVLIGACGVHISIGSVYAWSVLTNPIAEKTGWDLSSITLTFSIAIFFLGTSAGFLGNKVQSWGVKKSIRIAAFFFTLGLLVSSYAIQIESLPLLYLGYGVLGGIELGVGYISPVATLLKWFPEKKGFAGGCAVMAFGFAALIAGPVIHSFVDMFGLRDTFLYLSIIYGSIMLFSSILIIPAPKKKSGKIIESTKKTEHQKDYTPHEAMCTKEFKILWTVFFINILCGISLLSIASPMVQQLGGTAVFAASMVGMLGLYNGSGRILSAFLSDYLGRGTVYTLFFLLEVIAFYGLMVTDNIYIFQYLAFAIVVCYGGGFSCMPAYLADIFGLKYLSVIHGRILTAWGLAGIVGPYLLTKSFELTGEYTLALSFFCGLFILSLGLIRYLIYLRKTN